MKSIPFTDEQIKQLKWVLEDRIQYLRSDLVHRRLLRQDGQVWKKKRYFSHEKERLHDFKTLKVIYERLDLLCADKKVLSIWGSNSVFGMF